MAPDVLQNSQFGLSRELLQVVMLVMRTLAAEMRGRRVSGEIKQKTERHVSRSLAPLTPAERAQLMTTLRVLARVLGSPGDLSCPPESPST